MFVFYCSYARRIFAQKPELSVAINFGWLQYNGSGLAGTSSLNTNALNGQEINYTNNPYGQKFTLSYGISLNSKYFFNNNLFAGLDLGFERLRSKTEIARVSDVNPAGFAADLSASGETFLNANALNLHPNAGYRFGKGKTTIDLTGGLDLALILHMYEKGHALAANGKEYFSDKDRKTIGTDIRPRFQVAVNYKSFGLYSGYSIGLNNYKKDFIGGVSNTVLASMLRFWNCLQATLTSSNPSKHTFLFSVVIEVTINPIAQ